MNTPRRPSLWHRLVGGRRKVSSPDFGDMGTAFGLEAITPAMGDWELVHVAAPEVVDASERHAAYSLEPHDDPRAGAHMLSTREPL